MLRLQVFGGVVLSDATGSALPLQRRRLALLAILAAAGERGVSRDKLIGRLWSESPGNNARHALEQLLYSIRRQFPPEGLISGVDPLRLEPSVIESDVQEFERVLARKAWSEVAALYRGPFLDGFYLRDEGFEEWVETERSRFAGEHAAALHRLAREADTGRHHTEAIAWWSKLAALDPLSERSAVGLARAMAGAGDVASALRQAQAYEALVRRELSVSATPELAAFVREIRQASEPRAEPHGAVPLIAAGERYAIQREIGRGSMATVYRARDLKHNRLVALKVLRPELAASAEARRFLREIAIAAALYHPHIVQLYDSGVLEGHGRESGLFYVMPYLEGESLRERLQKEVQLAPEVAARIAAQVAEALAYAHGRGVVHRDVKPENILLEGGEAFVTDFGIAHALEASGGEKLTQTGIVLGTPMYMSPEQAVAGGVVDGRSDIYGLGCVLYEMISGEPPFSGRTTQAILARHASDPVPPLRTLCPDVSPQIEGAVLRAMAKRPEDRFGTAADLAAALTAG